MNTKAILPQYLISAFSSLQFKDVLNQRLDQNDGIQSSKQLCFHKSVK